MTNFFQVVSFDPLQVNEYVTENVTENGSTIDDASVSSSTTYSSSKIEAEQATNLKTPARGAANGVASLDGSALVPTAQVPDLSSLYLATSQKGAAGGLDAFSRYNLAKYGGDPSGTSDNATAFTNTVAALPPLQSVLPGSTVSGTLILEGGGEIVIPPGIYKLGSNISVPARTRLIGYGVTIVATATGAGFTVNPNEITGSFTATKPVFEGFTFDGANIATTAIQWTGVQWGALRDVIVVRCTSHGIKWTGVLFSTVDNVVTVGHGGWGMFVESYDPGNTKTPASNNNTITRLHSESCASGGLNLEVACQANTIVGLTSQYHQAGAYGARVAGATSFSNTFLNPTFENNTVDLFVDANDARNPGTPKDTILVAPEFFADFANPVTTRYVINEGLRTTLYSPLTDLAGPQAARNGVYAMYEQAAAYGTMRVVFPNRITGSGNFSTGGSHMFVDDASPTANDVDPSKARHTTGTGSVQVVENDPRQNIVQYFQERQYIGSAATDYAYTERLVGDTGPRRKRTADGHDYYGPGDGTYDVELYRSGTGALTVVGNLRPKDKVTDLAVPSLPWQTVAMYAPVRVRQALTHSAGGAQTVTTKGSGDAILKLTSNCSGMTFSNPGLDGFEFRISVDQDATGGRTYVFPTNCRFAGNTAPSDTTANTRTTVNFVYDNTLSLWIETARSVAVPIA